MFNKRNALRCKGQDCGDNALLEDGVPVGNLCHDLPPVDRVSNRLPNPNVAYERPRDVEVEMRVVDPGFHVGLHFRNGLRLHDIGGWDLRPQIDIAGLQEREQGISRRDQLVGNPLQFWSAAKIVRIGLQIDAVAALPINDAKWTDANRLGVVRNVVDVWITREQMLG